MINSTIALVHSGRAISFLDLSNPNKQWTHYLSDDTSIDTRDYREVRMVMNDDSE